ncbi:MAG: altronate dehydratase family protein [Betaproteobacteria bacterium]
MLQAADITIRLNAADDVVIARVDLPAGTEVIKESLRTAVAVPAGHKIASRDIREGEPVRRYNQIIGFATRPIRIGEHVHVHNLGMASFERDYAFGADFRATDFVAEPATFQGYVRADGRVATRNFIGLVSSVNCSAHVTRLIARHFTDEVLAEFPNVAGVVPIVHSTGCGMGSTGEPVEVLRRVLAGYATHANFHSSLLIGLGCEANQINDLLAAQGLKRSDQLQTFTIQDTGGTGKTIREGIARVKALLPDANRAMRQTVPASHITLGLQCGGSDGYSGISANPALGAAVDLLVRHGGSAILSETPEIYGAEHLLTRRAASREVGEKLVGRIKWWEDYTTRLGGEMNNNPSPGNKAGGLTTILEKSLGAVAKGGTSALMGVYHYAERVSAKGFVFMDTPGYDPVSATGQVAGGANMICFTTGRGSAYGCKPAPSLKLATNTALFNRQEEDMDINCGVIVDGKASIDEVGKAFFDLILQTASGDKSKSEQWGYGDDEFAPWVLGPTM